MDFVDWDLRPAVLGETEAKAMPEPGGDWVSVDFSGGAPYGRPLWLRPLGDGCSGISVQALDKLPVLDQPASANSETARTRPW